MHPCSFNVRVIIFTLYQRLYICFDVYIIIISVDCLLLPAVFQFQIYHVNLSVLCLCYFVICNSDCLGLVKIPLTCGIFE